MKKLLLFLAALFFYAAFSEIININQYRPGSPFKPEAWASVYEYKQDELIGVDFNRNNRGRIYLNIKINETETDAYLDTGNAFGICLSEVKTDINNFQITDYVNVYNSEGNLVERSPKFKVDSFFIEDKQMNLDYGIFVKGKDSFVGFKPFAGGRITIDYENEMVAISNMPMPANLESSNQRQIFKFLTPEGNGNGYIIIPVKIDGEEYYAMVDTGASVSVIDEEVAKTIKAEKNIFGRVKVNDLEIGSFVLDLSSVSVHSQRSVGSGSDKKIMATIGADVLCRFLVTIDYRQDFLILESSNGSF